MKRIFLVDDDENIQEIFHITFNAKYSVTGFKDGDTILNRRARVPDLFVLDKMHSGFRGLELCRFIKADELYQQVPVMILSAARNILTLGKAAGADKVIEKPFCLNYLQEQVAIFTA